MMTRMFGRSSANGTSVGAGRESARVVPVRDWVLALDTLFHALGRAETRVVVRATVRPLKAGDGQVQGVVVQQWCVGTAEASRRVPTHVRGPVTTES